MMSEKLIELNERIQMTETVAALLDKNITPPDLTCGEKKDLQSKLPVHLVAPEMIEALAEGLEAGVKKGYAPNNWQKGLALDSISVAAAMRHILQWRKGVDIDNETQVNHLQLAFLNLGMAVTQIKRKRLDLDDRVL